ncbi:MAG: TIR domain-containing protein [Sulfuricurvum sp.]|nr:TIR domain-containing protein [Sulfuricurvum sp.]
MSNRHKVFISYHHDGNKFGWGLKDSDYREAFEKKCSKDFEIMISKAVQDGDIPPDSSPDNTHRIIRDQYLRDSTVTVVLIGNDTWRRKHVDWEIASSLRQTQYNPRSGVIGILLPTFNSKEWNFSSLRNNHHTVENLPYYSADKSMLPERFVMNLDNGFAKLYDWTENAYEIQEWIHEAFERRKITPDNSLLMFKKNR